MPLEIDVAALCVERAEDAEAFVGYFISEASGAEPAAGFGSVADSICS